MQDINKILVLGPHTDDGELGCGGTIAKLVEAGKEVHYAAFSIAEDSVPAGLPKDILVSEIQAASRVLGIAPDNLLIYRYPVRKFPQQRQEILEDLVKLRNRIQPDLVLLPASTDVHQDHQTIAQEGVRAFKLTRILGYELPWNNLSMATGLFVLLEEKHLLKKLQAIDCYASQKQAGRNYADESFIRGLARTRGVQIGAEYAEGFEVVRWVVR